MRDKGLAGQDLVRPSTLSSLAKESIRMRIVTGEIVAGEIYSAPALAAVLGVSATPVREAMLELTADGLVEAVPNRGFRVVELSPHDLDEIFEIRLMLEVPAAQESARRGISDADRDRFLELAELIEKRAQDGDMVGFLAADRDFHLGLLATLGNSRLVEIVSRLRDQARLYGLPMLAQRGQLRESAREHREMLEAICRRDAAGVASVTTHHLEHTRGIWAGIAESANL
ncbi:MAG TPA: GntR family transcriptional regulator [Streptosporangiaceae bacterium]